MRSLYRLLLALAAPAALGLVLEERDETLNGTEVDLSTIAPFEMYPGFIKSNGAAAPPSARGLEAQRLQKRGFEASAVCAAIKYESPRSWGWMWKEAYCTRPMTKIDHFRVDCMGRADHTEIVYGVKSRCGGNRVCTEFYGYNGAGIQARDIYCAERKTLRQWAIDSTKTLNQEACSPNYVNKVEGHKHVQMALEVNVLDSTQSERISPNRVYYTLDGKAVGNERSNDASVGSGVLDIPWGGRVQACVQAKTGQELWAMSTMTGLSVLSA